MTDYVENKIYSDTYDLFDKALYGGIGHGVIIFPTHIFKIIFTVIFPPIGEVLNAVEKLVLSTFPYITWEVIMTLLNPAVLNRIIYSYILTSLFYIPGLVYTLSKLTIGSSSKSSSNGTRGSIICNADTGVCEDSDDIPIT